MKKDNTFDSADQVEMKICDAYEVTKLAHQKISIEKNPAYESVRIRLKET